MLGAKASLNCGRVCNLIAYYLPKSIGIPEARESLDGDKYKDTA